ncbi:hypothetical protein HDE_08566 [Halotydeus destructor]|nr:hypothetical protein HDE_08566 [Halotydeus destructor]
MLIAIRRRDDGPLTLVLSFVGWSSLITSRIIAITVAATHFHRFMFLLCLVHVVCMTFWVYRIAMASHCDPNSSTSSESDVASNPRKRLSLAILVFLFFGIPSLLIWPFMFQLREQTRPAIFLFITTVENVFLIGMWLVIELIGNSWQVTGVQMMIFWSVVMTTLGGSFFLLLYVFCKPKYTDQVVLHEIRESRMADAPTVINGNSNNARAYNATQYGIYYEFCDLVFKLPSTQKIGAGLEEITSLQST